MRQTQTNLNQDKLFRTIVMASTGLGFAAMVGSMAALRLSAAGTFEFAWRWTIPVWMGAAVVLNALFWALFWRYQAKPTPALKSKLVACLVLVAAFGLGAFLYPIRFLAPANYAPIFKGLVTATLALGVAGRIMFVLGRGIRDADEAQLKSDEDRKKD